MIIFPKFFPKTIQRLIDQMNVKPLIYDVDGKFIPVCSSPVLHNIKRGRCVWCNRSVQDLTLIIDSQVEAILLNPQQLKVSPQPDFNMTTSATVNTPKVSGPDPLDEIFVDSPKPQSMDLGGVKAYCMKCKNKVVVLKAEYSSQDSRRGVRNYLKGSCSVCGSNICAIVKKGDV
jgi:hypothetical protein